MNSHRSFRAVFATIAALFTCALTSHADEDPPENPTPADCCVSCVKMDEVDIPKPDDKGNFRVTITGSIQPFFSNVDCSEVKFENKAELEGNGKIVDIQLGNGAKSITVIVEITSKEVEEMGDKKWKVKVFCDPDAEKTDDDDTSSTGGGCSVSFKLGCESDCGSGSCDGSGSPGTDQESFTVTIPTTPSYGGLSSGNLRFHAPDFSNPGRSALVANVPSNFIVHRDNNHLITSVETGAATLIVAAADPALVAIDPNAFTVTHRNAENQILRTTTISFVNDSLRMDTEFDNAITRHQQTRDLNGSLILEKGRLNDNAFEPLWQETLVKDHTIPGKRVHRRIVKERPTPADDWQTASDIETTEENLIGEWVKTKEVIDPSDTALTSTWTYYQPGEVTGENSSTAGLGRLKLHLRHDGYESFHTYSLHRTTVTTPYAGDPAGKTTTNIWNPVERTRTITVEANGQILSKTETIHTDTSFTRNVHTSDSGTLTTVTHQVPVTQPFGGKPLRTLHPDGTLTTYDYEFNEHGGMKTITRNGVTADGLTVSQGTETLTVTNSRGTTILRQVTAIGHGTGTAVFESMAVTEVDALGRPETTAWFPASVALVGEHAAAPNPAWTTSIEYSCCGIARETDKYGIETFHAYDHLQRRIKTNRLGVTTETHYLGLTTETHRYPETVSASLSPALNGTAATLVARSVTNLAGTLRESWSPDPTSSTPGALVKSSSTTTTYKPAAGLSTRTVTTVPGNHTQTTDSFLDGRTAKTSGDLSPAMTYAYTVNSTGEVTTQSYLDGATLRETTTTQTDWAGRTKRITYMDNSFAGMDYNALGQMVKSTDPEGVATLFAYNAKGERTVTAIDLNRNDEIDDGSDTVSFSVTEPGLDGSNPVFVTTNKVWHTNDANQLVESVVSTSKRSPSDLFTTTQSIGHAHPSTSETILNGNGSWTTTTTAPDGTYTVTTYTGGLMDISENFDADDNLIASTAMRDSSNEPLSGYDTLNRPTHQRDSRTGVTITAYLSDTADFVKSITDPGNRSTAFTYDSRGRRTHVDAPDTLDASGANLPNITITHYFPDSTVQETTGGQTYRVTHTYDYAQRQKTLTTYGTETAATTWIYSPDRGFLVEKNHAGESDNGPGNTADYTYTAAGRLKTRTWERGVVTTYGYDNGGRLQTVDYTHETNGHTTPNLVNTYDALGRLRTVTRGGVLHAEYTYRSSDLQRHAEIQQIDTLNQAVT